MTNIRLFLVSANRRRPGGKRRSADDYDVHDGAAAARVVGRVCRAGDRLGEQWFWSITSAPSSAANNGYAGTREAAMAALKARWVALSGGG